MKRLLVILFATVTTAHGQLLKDQDFSMGRGAWIGGGKLVKIDAAGAPVITGTEGAPVLEISLAEARFTEIHQSFLCLHGEEGMKVAVVLKVSSDFARNDNAPYYNSDWKVGGSYVWSGGMKYPRVDLIMRVDTHSHHYRLCNLKPGGDWQTVTVEFGEMTSKKDHARPKEFSLVFPAGKGTVQIKSISAEPL